MLLIMLSELSKYLFPYRNVRTISCNTTTVDAKNAANYGVRIVKIISCNTLTSDAAHGLSIRVPNEKKMPP